MLDPELLERITARRAELDELEEQLAEVRAERDELAVTERVFERVSEQLAVERESAGLLGTAEFRGVSGPACPGCRDMVQRRLTTGPVPIEAREDRGPRASASAAPSHDGAMTSE
ncbi:hypothetical protein AB0D71_21095 [Streptomyces avermitilis]|uniref:hypothetical protein n=1 Tax=Streptomyces avermitilis TaxID=33903 RepID=UPI0033DAD9DE